MSAQRYLLTDGSVRMVRPVQARSVMTAAACLAAGGLANLTGASAASRQSVCGPAGAHTLAADSSARVYSRRGAVYGCAQGGPRSYRLGAAARSLSEGRAGPIALAGVEAAYGLTSYGVDTVTAEVVVRRLSDGRVMRRHAAITGSVGAESAEQVAEIVVKPDGSVAWIANDSSIPSSGHTASEVEKSDRGPGTLLDKEPSGLHELRLTGSHLTWRYRSATRSATLR